MSPFWWTMCNNRKVEKTAAYLQSPLRHCCVWDKIQRKNVLIKKSCVNSCSRASKKIWPCSSRKPAALQEKKTRKFFMSGTVLFTATVECLTMAMRWCNVLPAKVGFTVSAKWVILTAYFGGVNHAKMYLKRSKRGKVNEKKRKTKCSNYDALQRNTQ